MLRCAFLKWARNGTAPFLSRHIGAGLLMASSAYTTLSHLSPSFTQINKTLLHNAITTSHWPHLQQRRYQSNSSSSSSSTTPTPNSECESKEAQSDKTESKKQDHHQHHRGGDGGSNNKECTELIVGNTKIGIHESKACHYRSADFIGTLHPSLHIRANAGDILALIDVCAARTVYCFVKNAPQLTTLKYSEVDVSISTIAFNSFTFSKPVFEGDLIELDGFIVHSGNTSIGAHISVFRQSFDCPTPTLIGESFVTMITVERDNITQPKADALPAVKLTLPEEIAKHKLYVGIRDGMRALSELSHNNTHWANRNGSNNTATTTTAKSSFLTKEQQQQLEKQKRQLIHSNVLPPAAIAAAHGKISSLPTLRWKDIELPENVHKPLKLKMSDTITDVYHTFGIESVNINNAIFGGEILRYMELCALHCGRTFARFGRLYTLAMNDMQFTYPIYMNEVVRCTTMVSCVRRSTLLVNVLMYVGDATSQTRFNRASFILIALDTQGNPVELNVGLDLSEASDAELQSYWCATQLMIESGRRRSKS